MMLENKSQTTKNEGDFTSYKRQRKFIGMSVCHIPQDPYMAYVTWNLP